MTCRIIAENGIKFDRWLEPCAGDGAFLDLLPAHMRLGIDIESRRPDIIEADFLTFDDFAPGVSYAAIGNIPWGENGPVKFFNRCADHCSVIAFLVPLSFRRPHAINQLDRRFRLLHEEVCPRGHPPLFPGVFQIWVRGRFVARINSRAQSAPRSDIYGRRTYSGRPSSSMRFSVAMAMATSVICRPPVRERSASPITRL